MPSCQAYECYNTTGKANGKRFYSIPNPKKKKEKTRAATRLHNIGTGYNVHNFKFGNTKFVCSDHFHQDCFNHVKRELIEKYVDPSKCYLELLPGAVPMIFKHRIWPNNMDGKKVMDSRSSSLKRSQEDEQHQVCINNFLNFFWS